MGLADLKDLTTSICPPTKKELTFSPRTITNFLKSHLANLASDLVKKLPDSIGKRIKFRKKNQLKFEKVSSVSILKILKEFKTNKATMVDNLAGRFLNPLSVMLPSYKNQSIDLHSKSID